MAILNNTLVRGNLRVTSDADISGNVNASTFNGSNLNLINDSSNSSSDALAYLRHRSNNDWNLILDSEGYDFGLDIRCANNSSYALKVNGGVEINNGSLKLNGYNVVTATQFGGTYFESGNSGNGLHDANAITYNSHDYYTSNGPSGIGESTSDGALYTQAYSSNWVAQIAQDYRNGRLFVRGKNSGSWADWKRIAQYEEIPTNNNQLTNGARYITALDFATTSSYGTVTIGNTEQYNPGLIPIMVATVAPQGHTHSNYLTGITSSMVTNALGYTPYNSSNPNGYITSSALSEYLPLSAGSSYPLTGDLYTGGHSIYPDDFTQIYPSTMGNARVLGFKSDGGIFSLASYRKLAYLSITGLTNNTPVSLNIPNANGTLALTSDIKHIYLHKVTIYINYEPYIFEYYSSSNSNSTSQDVANKLSWGTMLASGYAGLNGCFLSVVNVTSSTITYVYYSSDRIGISWQLYSNYSWTIDSEYIEEV